MSVRKKTTNRLRLIRTCYVCGKTFPTTADSPFMRQLYNVDGKKQKTCYFCSQTCKNSTYKHNFDGLADQRRYERDLNRDNRERNRLYYQRHADAGRERAKQRYHDMSQSERDAANWYRRAQRYVASGGTSKQIRSKFLWDGALYSGTELADMAGISYGTFQNRLYRLGWSIDRIMSEPAYVGKNQYTREADHV